MIEGIGRMQPVAPATAETNGRSTDAAALRGAMTVGRMPAAEARGVSRADVSLQRMGAAMAASPPVDAGKVASLRVAIEAGNYKPQPMMIAEAMLRQAGA